MKDKSNNVNLDRKYFSKIIMMIIFSVELIIFIVNLVMVYSVKSNMNEVNEEINPDLELYRIMKDYGYDYDYRFYNGDDFLDFGFIFKEQEQGISACIAFFIIGFIFFLLEFIVYFGCENNNDNLETNIFHKLFFDWNHMITVLSFIIGQFMYLISCVIIPIYLNRTVTLKDDLFDYELEKKTKDKIESCIAKYAVLLTINFTFLFIFIFLYFIIMNLYKSVFCDMEKICNGTNNCLGKFFGCFKDRVYCIFTCGKARDKSLNELTDEVKRQREMIKEITCEIQEAMKRNMELRIENIDYL